MTKIHHAEPATFRRAQLLRFTRHYLEMVVAMAAGMMVLPFAMLYRRSEYT